MHPPAMDPLVFEALQANAGADFVRQLVEAFAEEAPTLIARLRSAVAAGDAEAFETTAHSLKGNGATFGALRLADRAGRLEWQGLAASSHGLDELADELTAAVLAMRRLAQQ